MTPHREWIRNMVPCKIPVSLANDHIVWATGKGQVLFNPVIYGARSESVLFDNVLYVPALQNNLFSILHVVKNSKVRVVIEGNNLEFSKGGKTILMATIHSNMGLLDGTTLSNIENAYISQRIDKDLLHQRLGHIGKDRLNTLLRLNLADGILTKPFASRKSKTYHHDGTNKFISIRLEIFTISNTTCSKT